jgi:hypothetical protein
MDLLNNSERTELEATWRRKTKHRTLVGEKLLLGRYTQRQQEKFRKALARGTNPHRGRKPLDGPVTQRIPGGDMLQVITFLCTKDGEGLMCPSVAESVVRLNNVSSSNSFETYHSGVSASDFSGVAGIDSFIPNPPMTMT